jgi:hypothetical protein
MAERGYASATAAANPSRVSPANGAHLRSRAVSTRRSAIDQVWLPRLSPPVGRLWVIRVRSAMSTACLLCLRLLPNCCITATDAQRSIASIRPSPQIVRLAANFGNAWRAALEDRRHCHILSPAAPSRIRCAAPIEFQYEGECAIASRTGGEFLLWRVS